MHKTYPYFDSGAYMIIVGAILGISVLLVFYVYLIILNKDDMNYDENDYGTNNSSRMHDNPSQTDYTDATDASNCSLKDRDPKSVANTNFLKQLF